MAPGLKPNTGEYLRPLTIFVILVLCALLMPQLALAQSGLIRLTVRIVTVAGEPLPNIAVQVIDAATNQPLSRGTTNGQGEARFTDMMPTEVRVRLTGTTADGTTLRHTRQDERGIWVSLPQHDWLMDLRADTDGLVFPDLGLGNAGAPDGGAATAIAEGSLPIIYPTAPAASAAPQSITQESPRVPPSAGIKEVAESDASFIPSRNGGGAVLLMLLIVVIGGVAWLLARARL